MPGKKGGEVESTVHKKRREDQQPSRLEKSGGKENCGGLRRGFHVLRPNVKKISARGENFGPRTEKLIP